MKNYELRFKELNKRYGCSCNNPDCLLSYVNDEDDTLICGCCEEKLHMDWFCDSKIGYICTKCELKNNFDSLITKPVKFNSKIGDL